MSAGERVRRSFNAQKVSAAAKHCLTGDDAKKKLFLAWLADACHATETVARGTQSETDRAIGRREVWLLIQDTMNMTETDIRDLQEQVAGWENE